MNTLQILSAIVLGAMPVVTAIAVAVAVRRHNAGVDAQNASSTTKAKWCAGEPHE